jgi:hypothetical protein
MADQQAGSRIHRQFGLKGKTFRAMESGKPFNPDDLTIVQHYRLEG